MSSVCCNDEWQTVKSLKLKAL